MLQEQQQLFLNLKVVQDLIYNEPTKLVSKFKDYLIFDDINEFLKRSYTKVECFHRLPRLAQCYSQLSTPNYI